jgi:cell division protein FtsN
MNFQTSRLIFVLGLEGSLGCLTCATAIAQDRPPVLHRLPPPPTVREVPNASSSEKLPVTDSTATESTSVTPNRSQDASAVREFVFRVSPQTPISIRRSSSPDPSATLSELYRVEVLSRNKAMLARVRQIEPMAFVRRGETVIQVGLFRQRSQAEQRLQQLTSQGLFARIITVKNNVRPIDRISLSR